MPVIPKPTLPQGWEWAYFRATLKGKPRGRVVPAGLTLPVRPWRYFCTINIKNDDCVQSLRKLRPITTTDDAINEVWAFYKRMVPTKPTPPTIAEIRDTPDTAYKKIRAMNAHKTALQRLFYIAKYAQAIPMKLR